MKASFWQAKIQNDLKHKRGASKWPMLEIPLSYHFLKEIAENLQIEATQEKDIMKIDEILYYKI